jgi:nucleoside-diphosphate-sugar epimerase
VLVTGAGGFVGRPAVAALRARGFEVHGFGRHDTDLLTTAPEAILRDVAPTHLLHLAWSTEHGRFWDDPANDDWVEATTRLVDAFRSAGGERVVVAGSCAQYDWSEAALGPDGIAHERTTPRRPATRYGRAKESMTSAIGDGAAVGLVFFPYGPNEAPERLVPSITRALLAGTPAEVTSGTQVRDFLHIDDCGAAFAALVDSDVTGPVNIGAGVGAAIVDVASSIAEYLDREDLLRVGARPDRTDEPLRLVADVARLRDEVGFEPRHHLESGLRDAVEWWRQRVRRK